MNSTRFIIFTVITRVEAGQDEVNMFTSYFNARLEMHQKAQRSDVLEVEIYEESIGLSGRKTNGLVDHEYGKSVFIVEPQD